MATNKTFTVNGVNLAGMVERDSYATSVEPVYCNSVTTMDGVDHTACIRFRGKVTVTLNPQTAAQTATLWSAVSTLPATVTYSCLQRNSNVTANMTLDAVSAAFLSRCIAGGSSWNELESITFTEL